MILIVVFVAISFHGAFAHGDDDDDHGGSSGTFAKSDCGCQNASCAITDNLKVNSLCAKELCINGSEVLPPFQLDPCRSYALVGGKIVSAPIKDCCKGPGNGNCAASTPPCHHATCVVAEGETYGFCKYDKLPDEICCTCSSDCPKRPCKRVECVARGEGASPVDDMLVKRSLQDGGGYHMINEHTSIMNVPGTCVYREIPEVHCCESSNDCECEDNYQGACVVPGVCQCFSTCKNECGSDDDCTPLNATLSHWKDKQCIVNKCVGGFCIPQRDDDVDQDNDGIPCEDDCDDRDAKKGKFIYCTVKSKSEIDADGDGFVHCGSDVVAECLNTTTCPDDRVEIPKADLAPSVWDDHMFQVIKNCDCCDNNANTSHPDSRSEEHTSELQSLS